MMRELALFAGAGGGILGSLLLGHRIAAAVESNPYRRDVLRQRQADGLLEPFPIYDDVRTFKGDHWRGKVDLISAGFPCQPFSMAGKRQGENDGRNMWPETARIIREVGSPYVYLENVPALLSNRYFGRILGDLAESGYDAWWDCVPASAVGAPHQRDRLWILAVRRGVSGSDLDKLRIVGQRREDANADEGGRQEQPQRNGDPGTRGKVPHRNDPGRLGVCDPHKSRCKRRPELPQPAGSPGIPSPQGDGPWWSPESRVPLVAHGVADRVEQLEATGDGQVPLVAAYAFVRLAEIALRGIER